ncbi:MAG: hypothetical protein EOP50_08905, partial [Sphingobacteriales bacterium]
MRNIYLLFCGLLLAAKLTAQTPANDSCSAATLLTVNDTTGVTGSFYAATTSSGNYDYCAYSNRPDLWYRFTAVNNRQVILVQAGNPGENQPIGGIMVFSGTCGSLQALTNTCVDPYTSVMGGGLTRMQRTATGLVPGATYYVRLTMSYSAAPFRIAVLNEPPVPGCVTLLEPAAGATNVNYELPQVFRWSAEAGAARYELRISPAGNSDRVFYSTDTTDT